jgi:hypothetical protein
MSVQEFDCVYQEITYRSQRFGGSLGTPWQVQDQCRPASSADCSAESGQWRFLRTFQAHSLRDTFDQLLAQFSRYLWSQVAGSNASAASSYDQRSSMAGVQNGIANLCSFVRYDRTPNHIEAMTP